MKNLNWKKAIKVFLGLFLSVNLLPAICMIVPLFNGWDLLPVYYLGLTIDTCVFLLALIIIIVAWCFDAI